MALSVLVVCCPCAFALNPSLDISQYAHTAWKIREGFFGGTIQTIAQTPDGYLWLGTEVGLLRFDGIRSVPWRPPSGEQLPSNDITRLLAARDGTLWIGTLKGLASLKDGKLLQYHDLAGQTVAALLEDREGTVWAGGLREPMAGRLCEIHNERILCHGGDVRLGLGVLSLCEDRRGSLWAGAGTGLWRWKPGVPRFYPPMSQEMHEGILNLIEGDNGALLLATPNDLKQFLDGKMAPYAFPSIRSPFKPSRLFRDRDGGLWIGTQDRGLLHIYQGRTDVFAQSDGLSSDDVQALFEDREGNIWVGSTNGLDRFSDFGVPTISVKQGLSSAVVWSVLSDEDGSVWLGTVDALNRWSNGEVSVYRKRMLARPEQGQQREVIDSGLPDAVESLFRDDRGRIWVFSQRGVAYLENGRFTPVNSIATDLVNSLAGDTAGNLWIGDQDQGLIHLHEGKLVEQIPWARLGQTHFAHALAADPAHGGVWLGFYQGGVAHFKDGQIRTSYKVGDGLGAGTVADLRFDREGALWAATEGGLSRVKDGRVTTLTSKNGLPCDSVQWAMEDNDDSYWLYMGCGLVRIERKDLAAWVIDPKLKIEVKVFDSSDGVRSRPIPSGFSPRVAKTPDGKLWFLPGDGVSVIDPHHLSFNKLPPPVHVEQITADRETYAASSGLRLPPLIRDLEIDYAALSLVAPEKDQFRYKLEGHDRDWESVGNRRQAFYNDLRPGSYRFRVIASNNSGVWNEQGAALDFSIAPAYWQTNWFRAACATAFLLVLWALYQLRLRQVAQAFNARLEERVAERTRIARDLHDTLLQSFQGLLLRFQTVRELLRMRPAEAEELLESAIDQTARAITEGRNAVQGLRASTVERNDLAVAIRTLGEELAAEPSTHAAVGLQVDVEGTPQTLHPIVRDEIYRIAGEALRNAFRHAGAQQIEVELRYDERQFRLRIRDDGKGIDPQILTAEAPPGHFGLPGMRERAKLIGGKLSVWTAPESGTEIELSIPGARAYAKSLTPRRAWFGEKLASKSGESES